MAAEELSGPRPGSPAVIVAAMLISPLMGPIMAAGLASLEGMSHHPGIRGVEPCSFASVWRSRSSVVVIDRGGATRARASRGTSLEQLSRVKIFCVAFPLAANCSRELQATSDPIATAEPRPAPTVISGSPRLASAPAHGTTFVTVGRGRIEIQPLLPRAHTVFHIRNRTAVAHQIVVRGETGSATASLPANGRTVLQLLLGTGAHDITCTMDGHQESARFETYAPGVPVNAPAEAPVRR